MRGLYWGILAQGHGSTNGVQKGLRENNHGQYSPERLKQIRLVSSLLYGTPASTILAFESNKYTADDHFHGNSPYGKIQTKKEPIRGSD